MRVGSLFVELGLDMRKFQSEMTAMQKFADKITASISKSMQKNIHSGFGGMANIANKESRDAANAIKNNLGNSIPSLGNKIRAALNFKIDALGINSVTTGLNTASLAFGALSSAAGAAFNLINQGFTEIVDRGKSFEAQMSTVASVTFTADQLNTEEGQKQFAALKQQAVDLGASMVFTAEEVGQAQEMLSRAGFSVNEVLASTPGLLAAAAAEGMPLAQATDIASSALRGFGISATDMGRVADVLAKTSAVSNASIESLGQSFKYIAPVAQTVGLEIEETSAAMGILADQGIKGTIAGRNLASGLMFLTTPSIKAKNVLDKYNISVYDSQGNFKNLVGILEELSKATAGQSEAQQLANIATLVGKDNAKSYLALLNAQYKAEINGVEVTRTGIEMLRERENALKNASGAAQAMANIRLDNLAGDIEMLSGDADSLAINLYNQAVPAMRAFVQVANQALNFISPIVQEVFGNIITFSKELYDAVKDDLTSAWNELGVAVKELAPILRRAFTFLAAFAIEAGKWGAGVVKQFAIGIRSAVRFVIDALKGLGAVIKRWLQPNSPPKIVPELDKYGKDAGELYINSFASADIAGALQNLGSDISSNLQKLTKDTSRNVITLGTAVGKAFTSGMQNWNNIDFNIYDNLVQDIDGVVRSLGDSGALAADSVIPGIQASREAIKWIVDDLHNWGEVSDDAINNLLSTMGDVNPEVESLVRSYGKMQSAALKVTRAQDELNRITEEYNSKIAPLRTNLDNIQKEKRRISDMKRIKDLQKDLASGELSAEDRQLAELEIAEIKAQQVLDNAEAEKDAAVDVAQTKLDAANKEKQLADDEYTRAQAQIKATQDNNKLIAEQISILKELAKVQKEAAEAALMENPTGLESTLSDLDTLLDNLDFPTPEDMSGITQALSDAQTSVSTFSSDLSTARDSVRDFFDIISGKSAFNNFISGASDASRGVGDIGSSIQTAFSATNNELIATIKQSFADWAESAGKVKPAIDGIGALMGMLSGDAASGATEFIYKISGGVQILNNTLLMAFDTLFGLGVAFGRFLEGLTTGDFQAVSNELYAMREKLWKDMRGIMEGSDKIQNSRQYAQQAAVDAAEQAMFDQGAAIPQSVNAPAAVKPLALPYMGLKAEVDQITADTKTVATTNLNGMRDNAIKSAQETYAGTIGPYKMLYSDLKAFADTPIPAPKINAPKIPYNTNNNTITNNYYINGTYSNQNSSTGVGDEVKILNMLRTAQAL